LDGIEGTSLVNISIHGQRWQAKTTFRRVVVCTKKRLLIYFYFILIFDATPFNFSFCIALGFKILLLEAIHFDLG
jgi:hypothetical protein